MRLGEERAYRVRGGASNCVMLCFYNCRCCLWGCQGKLLVPWLDLMLHMDIFGELTRTTEVTRHPLSHEEMPLLTLPTYKWAGFKSSQRTCCLGCKTVPQRTALVPRLMPSMIWIDQGPFYETLCSGRPWGTRRTLFWSSCLGYSCGEPSLLSSHPTHQALRDRTVHVVVIGRGFREGVSGDSGIPTSTSSLRLS